MFGSQPGPDAMSGVFSVIIIIAAALVAGLVLFVIVKTVGRSVANRNAPILSVDARVAGKREEAGGGTGETPARTRLYATFEAAGGIRMEFEVESRAYGLLAEGDEGKLTFQGTDYLSFQKF